MVRAVRRASRNRVRSGSPRRQATRFCRFTWKPIVHWTLNSWDRTQIPKPFATVSIAMGEPLEVPQMPTRRASSRRGCDSKSGCGLSRAGHLS